MSKRNSRTEDILFIIIVVVILAVIIAGLVFGAWVVIEILEIIKEAVT